MGSRLFYFGTEDEVQIGDRIEIRRWFGRSTYGRVCYIPGISPKHWELEREGWALWAIRYDNNAISSMAYCPDDPDVGERLSNRFKLLARGQGGELLPDERLEASDDAFNFVSNSFSLEPTVDPKTGWSDDVISGVDLAETLRARLINLKPTLSIETPRIEDNGSVFWVKDGETECRVYVHWVHDNQWGLQFARPMGCLAIILGGGSELDQCHPIQQLVNQVLTKNPQLFQDVEWRSERTKIG